MQASTVLLVEQVLVNQVSVANCVAVKMHLTYLAVSLSGKNIIIITIGIAQEVQLFVWFFGRKKNKIDWSFSFDQCWVRLVFGVFLLRWFFFFYAQSPTQTVQLFFLGWFTLNVENISTGHCNTQEQ